MQNAKFHTFSSFLLAVALYFGLVFVLFFTLSFAPTISKKFTDDKDVFIDIIVEKDSDKNDVSHKQDEVKKEPKKIEPPKQEQEQPKKPIEPETKPQPVPAALPSKVEPKAPDLQELFSTINTSKLTPDSGIKKPEKIDKDKAKNIQNEAETLLKSLKISNSPQLSKTQISGVYDPVLGAIQKQIEKKWQRYKADSNSVAKVKVRIDGNGRFSYEILELSRNDEFNKKVMQCLQELSEEQFAFLSNGRDVTFDLDLKDKLKTKI